MSNQAVFYRDGEFVCGPEPEWYTAVFATPTSDDADTTLIKAGWERYMTQNVGHEWAADIEVWKAPNGVLHVTFWSKGEAVETVFIPDRADWLPFYVGYVVPFIRAQAALRRNSEIERVANALIAYARHGEGVHIDRYNGKSKRDEPRP
jgi:hypothetical protein